MAVFKVGMRVRLARKHPAGVMPIGSTGTIRRFGEWSAGTLTKNGSPLSFDCNCTVDYDGAKTGDRGAHTDYLEPLILGDQHIAADDEALLLDLSRFAELARERVS